MILQGLSDHGQPAFGLTSEDCRDTSIPVGGRPRNAEKIRKDPAGTSKMTKCLYADREGAVKNT